MKRKIVESMSMEEAFRALNVKAKAKLHEGREEDYTIDSNLSICFYYMNVEDPHANADMIYEIVKNGRNWTYIDARDDDAVGNYKSAYEAIVAAIDAEYEMLKEQDENPEDYGLSGNDDDLHVVLVVDQTSNISDSELAAIEAKIDLFDELFTIHKVEFTLETDSSKDENFNESSDLDDTIKEGWEAEADEYYSGDELRQAVAEEMEFMLDQLGENVTLDVACEYFMELCAEARITFDRKELEAILRDEYGITETLNSKN